MFTRNVGRGAFSKKKRKTIFHKKTQKPQITNVTYFEPRLRHFRCPGMNFVAPDSRIEPDGIDAFTVVAADFAGDKFSDAIVDGSI